MSRLILKRLRFKDPIPTTIKQRNDTSNLNAKVHITFNLSTDKTLLLNVLYI